MVEERVNCPDACYKASDQRALSQNLFCWMMKPDWAQLMQYASNNHSIAACLRELIESAAVAVSWGLGLIALLRIEMKY
jgi:hypothetical protein